MDAEKLRNLKLRSELFRAIRAFFYDAGYIEVETPVKIHAPAPEEYIESVRAEGDFLRTSPELAMKVLLADGMEKIFQIGACFRANEFGRKHREEFTMLEFYCRGMAYREQAVFTADFVRRAAAGTFCGRGARWRRKIPPPPSSASKNSRKYFCVRGKNISFLPLQSRAFCGIITYS